MPTLSFPFYFTNICIVITTCLSTVAFITMSGLLRPTKFGLNPGPTQCFTPNYRLKAGWCNEWDCTLGPIVELWNIVHFRALLHVNAVNRKQSCKRCTSRGFILLELCRNVQRHSLRVGKTLRMLKLPGWFYKVWLIDAKGTHLLKDRGSVCLSTWCALNGCMVPTQ